MLYFSTLQCQSFFDKMKNCTAILLFLKYTKEQAKYTKILRNKFGFVLFKLSLNLFENSINYVKMEKEMNIRYFLNVQLFLLFNQLIF